MIVWRMRGEERGLREGLALTLSLNYESSCYTCIGAVIR